MLLNRVWDWRSGLTCILAVLEQYEPALDDVRFLLSSLLLLRILLLVLLCPSYLFVHIRFVLQGASVADYIIDRQSGHG